MTPQELKNSILQLAIQGRLVEQRPEEGTGEELFQQIQAEKQALIKAGKIKKDKPLPKITEDEVPFEIPESWKWVRLNSVISLLSGSDLAPDKYNSNRKGIPYITGASNIEETSILINRWTEYPNNIAHKGDLLLTCKGTVGKTIILTEDEVHVARQIMAITPVIINTVFVQHFIESQVENLKSKAKSMIPGIERNNVLKLVFPLPPLAEQKRIVAKIEELLPLIDRYEKAWSRLEEFNKRFPGDMQKSILQLAIQGRLVEQRPEEGTGEELYQQIQAEKQALIKAGKIKKEKPLPEITEAEVPFEIPESWKWVRLGNLAWFFDAGKSPNCQKKPVNGTEWGVITTTAIQLGYFDEKQNKVLPTSFSVNESMKVKSRDILITRAGPTNRTGVACLVNEIHHNLILSDKTLRINMTDHFIYKKYIIMVLNSPSIRQLIIGLMSGMDKQQVNISQEKYKTLLTPIPPLAEQKRIVAKLEELLPLCERLK